MLLAEGTESKAWGRPHCPGGQADGGALTQARPLRPGCAGYGWVALGESPVRSVSSFVELGEIIMAAPGRRGEAPARDMGGVRSRARNSSFTRAGRKTDPRAPLSHSGGGGGGVLGFMSSRRNRAINSVRSYWCRVWVGSPGEHSRPWRWP